MAERLAAQGHADRRQQVTEAAIQVIADNGVAGATVRKIAEVAGVSTGSVTYYFDDKEDIYYAAFVEFIDRSVDTFGGFYEGVTSPEKARTATVRMLAQSAADHSGVVLATELYAVSLRRPRYHLIVDQWAKRCRLVLQRYFDEDTAVIIDALYEGMLLHRGMRLGGLSEGHLAMAVERLIPPESFRGKGTRSQ